MVNSGSMRGWTQQVRQQILAVQDNQVTRMTTDHQSPREPAQFHRLKKMRVFGGFLDKTVFDFENQLNCLIGPRGSGKSTALELVRFAFDIGPSEGECAQSRRRFESILKSNLGGAQGRVEIEVETREGLSFTVSRQYGELPIVLDEHGEPTNLDLGAGALFRPEIFSQNDVETIADQPTFQRDLLDSFCTAEIVEATQAIRLEEAKLRQNSLLIGKLSDEVLRLREETKMLPDAAARLKGFAQAVGSNTEEINRAHALKSQRDKDERTTNKAGEVLRAVRDRFEQDLETFLRETMSVYAERPSEDPNRALMDGHRECFNRAVTEIDKTVRSILFTVDLAEHDLEEKSKELLLVHQKQELEFSKLMEKHNELTVKTKERIALEKRKNELEQKQRDLVERSRQLETIQTQRDAIIDTLNDHRDRRFEIRKGVADSITTRLAGNIRVEVIQNAERTAFLELLKELLASASVQRNVVAEKLADNFTPWELAELARSNNQETFIERSGLAASQVEKILPVLSRREAILQIEAVELDDSPRIELKEGQYYKDSTTLSTGQKCTAILPILLLENENPLLIDQPEDNLDNSFVYSDVVTGIRAAKHTRQLVFVTHNPNIPVLGEAERVFVLRSNGKAAELTHRGDVETCKKPIVDLLEGGEEAFKERQRRYDY